VYSENLEKASRWLECADYLGGTGRAFAWLAPEAPENQFISAEITGYLLSHCASANLPLGASVATWLCRDAIDSAGAPRCRWYAAENAPAEFDANGPYRWLFDCGIVLAGLSAWHANHPSPSLKQAIAKLGSFILDSREDGALFPARWDAELKTPIPDDHARWSMQSGAYHAKIDRSLFLAHSQCNTNALLDGLELRLRLYGDRFLSSDGLFLTYRDGQITHTHPHLYACEAYWSLGLLLGDAAWIRKSKAGVAVLAALSPNGFVPRLVQTNTVLNPHTRADAQAQYLRLLIAHEFPLATISAAVAALATFQSDTGAIRFGWNSDGTPNTHADVWGTIAARQALEWLQAPQLISPYTLI